nr:ATP-binding cassette domain-containing protein [Ligilactobacillus salivarius]
MGLGDQLNQSPGTLSGGQKQRLAIATAIVTDPSILVLDDPTSEMDPLGRQHFFSWLVSVEKKTIFIVSNEVDDLCEIADQIWVLKAGELVAAGKPLTVFNHLKPDWQLAEPTVFRLAKLMKWSIPGAADEFPVTNQQLKEAYYAAN